MIGAQPVVVVDLETTGLSSDHDCVWEVGAVVLRPARDRTRWVVGDTFQQTVRPQPGCFDEARRALIRRVSGLTDRDLLALWDSPPAEVVVPALAEWLRGLLAGEPVHLTAWNLAFERRFLESARFPLATALRSGPGLHYAPCLMEAAARRHVSRARWSLADACDHFGVGAGNHRALADASAAALVAIHAGVLPPLRVPEPATPSRAAVGEGAPVEELHPCLPDCKEAAEKMALRHAGGHVQPVFERRHGSVQRVGYAVYTRVAKLAVHRVGVAP